MNDDAPTRKRRSALRHAFGGSVLLVCLAANLWLVERAGWTDFGGCWRQFQTVVWGHGSIRAQVKVGMTRDEVRMRIGRGEDVCLLYGVAAERYHQNGFQVIFFEKKIGDRWEWFAERVEDWPGANSWRRIDEPPPRSTP